MKLIYPAILAGAALVGLAEFTPSLAGKEPTVHHLTVPLPGGGTETITYTGDVVPEVTVNPDPFDIAWSAPTAFGFTPSFLVLDRLSADMDREMEAFSDQIGALLPDGPEINWAALQALPAAGTSFSLISEAMRNGSCTRMVQITKRDNSERPEVVSRVSGNCAAETARATTPEPAPTMPRAINAQTTVAPVAARTEL